MASRSGVGTQRLLWVEWLHSQYSITKVTAFMRSFLTRIHKEILIATLIILSLTGLKDVLQDSKMSYTHICLLVLVLGALAEDKLESRETLVASKVAARVAELENHRDNVRRVVRGQRRHWILPGGESWSMYKMIMSIPTSGADLEIEEPHYGKKEEERVGRRIPAKEVLAYGDSLFVNPPSQNRCIIKVVNILTIYLILF